MRGFLGSSLLISLVFSCLISNSPFWGLFIVWFNKEQNLINMKWDTHRLVVATWKKYVNYNRHLHSQLPFNSVVTKTIFFWFDEIPTIGTFCLCVLDKKIFFGLNHPTKIENYCNFLDFLISPCKFLFKHNKMGI